MKKKKNLVIRGENSEVLSLLPEGFFRLIYIDPPFNTGKVQKKETFKSTKVDEGGNVGFGGNRYVKESVDTKSYEDSFSNYVGEFLGPKLLDAWRLLTDDGTIYVHLDYREAHYVKVWMDKVFGKDKFLNEIIWSYDYGAKSKKKWPSKHDTILVYVKDPKKYYFSSENVDREPYMAPGLVTKEKAERGKLPTDVWWHTVVPTNGGERTGYPTQKPLGILNRIINASSIEGDTVLDFFAGSGTTGESAYTLGRNFVLIDENEEAIDTMRKRFSKYDVSFISSGEVAGLFE